VKNEVIFFISLVFTNKDKVADKYEKYEHKKVAKTLCLCHFV